MEVCMGKWIICREIFGKKGGTKEKLLFVGNIN